MQELEVRLPPPRVGDVSLWPPAALATGTVLVVASLAALASQGLDAVEGLEAMMLVLAGVVIAGWGVLQLARGRRGLLRHETLIRLDGIGVSVHAADAAAMLTWSDVALVELRWWEIVPPYVGEPTHLPVLRFVPAHEGDIALTGSPGLSADLAHSFGISTGAAVLTVIVGPAGVAGIQELADWLGEHRSDVPVEVGAPPDL